MKKMTIILMILSSLVLTGCWDMLDVNNRIYPYSVGFDLDENSEEMYKISYSYPNIFALGKNPTSEEKAFVVSVNGNNIFQAMHHLTTRISFPMYLKHLKVVVFSEDVLNDSDLVKEIVDGVNRDFIANKNTQLLLAKDGSEALLQGTIKSTEQQIVGGTIYNLLLNQQESSLFTPNTMGNLVEDMDDSGASIIPVGFIMDGELHIEGGAVIKDYKMVGYLAPKENRAIAHLNNDVATDGIDVDYKGHNLSLMISESKTKKKLISKDENIKIRLDLAMEGHIHSYTLKEEANVNTQQDNKDMEREAAKVVEKEMNQAVNKIQKDLKADVLFIGDYLSKFHPKLWREIEKDWDELYPDIEIEVNVTVKIRRRGLTK